MNVSSKWKTELQTTKKKKNRWHSSSSDSTVFGLAASWKKLTADSLVFYTNVDNVMKYYINPAPAD